MEVRKKSLGAKKMGGVARWSGHGARHTKDEVGRMLLGLVFDMEERKRRSENIHIHIHTPT